jgi:hypothetical protein
VGSFFGARFDTHTRITYRATNSQRYVLMGYLGSR